MRVVLYWSDGAYERIRLSGASGTQLEGISIPYVSRKQVTQLAHALILPPTSIGYESKSNYVSEAKLTGSVSKPSAWLIGGRLISPADYLAGFKQLCPSDRYEIDRWLGAAKRQYTIGDEDAHQFVKDRLDKMNWEDIHEAALEFGGLKTKWKTEPLFRRHAVTPTGLAFWRLAVLLGFADN